MATEAKNTNYWISSTALSIQLNSMGEPDYIQCSVVSGASVLCYMSDVPGLGYDAGHNYQRWTLAAYPSIFPDSKRKYVYIAIPRQSTTDNNQATVVFPGQKIDIYGKTIPSSGTEGVQIGNEAYYYIFTGGIISAVKTDADNTRKREWEQHFDCGKLATDEAIASGGEGAWWRYNSVSDTITFLKEILKANFNELSANVARVTSLFLGGHKLKGVADSNGTLETSDDTVVTPHYLGQFGVKHFLAKDKDDTAHGTITWEKVQKFFSGLLIGNSNNENGGSWTTDAEGRSHLITDYLEVRMKAIFEELVINKTSTIGGKEIISPAGGVVAHKVEEVTVTYNNVSQKAYRCYFLAEQEGNAVDNDFAVGDQVRSESFNVRKGTYHKAGNHFYWRFVIGRDEDPVELEGKKYHYIDLSDTDCATASDVPAKGDVLNQCGNRTDVERQNCLIFSAVDTYSPSISLYHGINSYSFANKEYLEYGVNKQTNKAFFNVYGDMYVGDRPTKENGYEGSSYIRYDSSTKQLSVKGKISAKSTVDGKDLSQYIKENTDDTVANEAKKAAEDAQKAAQTAQTNITNLGNTVIGNKKDFDNYVTNGYLEPSEIAAMAQDSKRLEDDFAAAQKSYNEVKEAEVLANTNELIDLKTAFDTLTTAKTELVTYLSDISARYNKADTNGKATIVSAVGTKFTNFQSAYASFYDKLGLANAYITSKIYGDLKQNITDLAGYKYLKDALGQTTYVGGGLVMTTLLALRDGDGNVQSGINGAIDPKRGKKSIATWWGGQMVDKDYNSGNLTPATSLIRFDGSGYLANGAIWWDVSGKVHADPTSFIISEKNLGAYLTFFEPTWKEGSAGTSVADLVSLKPNAPFSKLGVSGDATFEGAISFHGIKLTYDSKNKAIKIDGNLYTTGGITAYGAGASTTGGGGLNASVISYARIIKGDYTDADLTSIPNAYAIKALSSRIDNIASELGGLSLSWNNITGKPSTFTPSAHTHKWTEITDRITKVSQLTNDKGYLTAHQSLASYYTKAEIDAKGYTTNKGTVTSVALTLPTGLTCATKTITTSGTFAISLASGYSIPTTAKQTAWDGAVSAKHTHSNKSVLDGITSTKVTCWDSAYDWYALITTDEETADGVINKWNEVVSFLANIAQTDTLSGIVDGINKSISDEVTRAKKAEGVNASGISTNKTSITTLQGYFTSGSAKKALQLTNTRKLWGNSFNGTADINGSIIVPDGKYISIGNIKMEYDATNKALKITNTSTNEVANLYTSGGVSAYGVGTTSSGSTGGGGLNGTVKSYNDAKSLTSESLSEVASAYSVAALYSSINDAIGRINTLEGGSATSIEVTGSGNAVTGVSKSGTKLTFTKGATFLTSHQDISGKSDKTHTHSVKINGVTKTIAATGGTAVDLGTYLTSHQSLAAYLKSADAEKTYSKLGHTHAFSEITGKPTTLAGYGVTDGVNAVSVTGNGNAVTSASIDGHTLTLTKGSTFSLSGHTHTFASLTSKPTTIAGYGITDAYTKAQVDSTIAKYLPLAGGTITGALTVNGIATFKSKVAIGDIYIINDGSGNLYVQKSDGTTAANFYATGGITAYGEGSGSSGGGGLNGSVKSYADALKLASESLSEIASAYSIKQLSTRITSLEGGSATSISVSGGGNAVTSVAKNGTTISVVKGSTFLTAHQSLAGYMKTATADAKYMYHSRGNIVSDLNSFATDGAAHIYEMNNVTNRPNRNSWVQVMNWGSGDSNYGFLLANDYSTNGHMYFRQKIAGSWKDWKTIIDSSNIGSQSVNYAASAGSVAWTNVSGRPSTMKNPSALSWSGYSSGSYDGSAAKSISIPNNTNQLTNGAGFITASASITGNAATATKVNHSLSVFGKSFNGSADVTVADTDLIASISTATSNLTDKTEILTSYASDNGFNDSNAKNRIHRRPASAIWGYINSKTISNADKLDNVHLNGIFTALSNTNNGVSMTIGTVAKSLANMQVYSATKLVTARNIALNGDLMGNANFDGSANITINGYMSYCNATVFNTNTYPWRRIAKVNELTDNYSDGCILLYISEGFNGGYYGIARVYIRTDNLSTGANASCSIQWISRNGYGLDSLKIAMYKTTGKAYYDVFLNMRGTYASVVIRTLQDQRGVLGKRFTLVNSTETANAASHTEAYATIEDAATAIHNQAYTSIAQGSDVATVHNADMVDGIHASGLFTNLSNSGNSLSITVGGTNKTLTVNYASNAGNADTLDGVHASGLFTNLSNSGNNISITIGGTSKTLTAAYATNCDTVDGYHAQSGSSKPYGKIPVIGTDGVIELGHFIDFHHDNTTGSDYSVRLQTYGNHSNVVTLPTATGTLALKSDNVASATKLQTARTIWGQSFNGTANVSGALSGATTISASNTISTTLQNGALKIGNKSTPISAIDEQVIFNTGGAIRFGETAWDWNQWAGLKYNHSSKTIYLGIADGSVFNANSAQRNGTLKFPGITTITPDAAARIGGSGGDLYLGNGNNTNWVKVQDMCSQVDSNNWKIMQGGYALFKDITIINTATINGSTHINNLLTAKGIMPTTADVNAFGTNVNNWDGSIAANVTNMFNGIPLDNIQVEYSMDNGATWNTYFGNPENRFNLINDNARGFNYYLGSNNLLGDTEADKLAQIKKNQLRVTVKIPDEIYQELSWISVDVNNGVDIKCQVYFGSSTGGYKEYVSKIMKGWSHKCDICVGPSNVNVGNDNYRYVRLVFSHPSNNTALRNGIVAKIRALALTKYSYNGDRYTISTTGHIYDYDAYMNTYFPNSILAKGGVTAYQSSDIRLKQDLRKLDYLGIIKAMGGTYGFAWKKDNTRSIGWIAQHVLCNPHLKDIVETDEKGYYKINYWSPKLIATAFGAIEQVGDEVSRLKARVVFLESEVLRLSGDKEDCNKKRLDNKNINSLN